MDRKTTYFGALIPETDPLTIQQNTMVSLAYTAQAFVGTATAVDGLGLAPTVPASLVANLSPGQIYQIENIEATPWSSLPSNTASSIMKQGLMQSVDPITFVPPTGTGYAQNFLVEVQYADLDTNPVLLPYYNAFNPSSPYSGPGGNGQSQNTARLGIVAVQVKAGIAATAGTQTTPTPDAGWVGLYVVTLAQGATTVTSGNITVYAGAPFIPVKLPAVPAGVQSGVWLYGIDNGSAGALSAGLIPAPSTLVDGMELHVKALNGAAGADTLTIPGAGSGPIIGWFGNPSSAKDWLAGTALPLLRRNSLWQVLGLLPSDVLALIQTVTRVNLTGNLTVYVRPDGSDSNNGLTNSQTGAFQTLQGAITAVFGKYNLAGFSLTIQLAVAAGQTTASFAGVIIPTVGVSGNIFIQGNDSSQGTFTITPVVRGDGTSVCISSDISTVTVSGVTLNQSTIATGSAFLATLPGAQIVIGNVTIVATGNNPSSSIFATYPGGGIARSGNVTINGTGGTVASVFQILEGYDGGVPGGTAKSLTINGLTFTQFYNVDQGRGSLLNTTFVASGVTGAKYNVVEGGVLALANGSLAAIPGTGGSAVGGYVSGDPGAYWTAFSPGVSTSSGAISSASGGMRFQRVGRTVVVEGVLGISNNGTGAGYITLSLPFAANATTTGSGAVTGSSKALTVIASAGAASLTLTLYDGTYPGATGATLAFAITYESAT